MENSTQLFETTNKINETLLDKEHTFSSNEFNLDKRLVKALSNMGFIHPTVVQSQCIPRLLEGKDLLVKANTGSGKTIAYGIPILQKLLSNNSTKEDTNVKVLILTPSRELCLQTRDVFKSIMKYINDLYICQVIEDGDASIQKARLAEHPDILISTPFLLVKYLNMGVVSIKNISTLVIDEADLTLSYGYEQDMKVITNSIPSICQSIFMSATLNDDLNKLRKGLLTNEVVIKVDEDNNKNINQYFINVKNRDEDILIFSLLKLNIIQGKILFFVNSIDRCYYLKLFLEQFSIPSAVLNSELPVKSRENIIQQFNKGKFDYLIATDESLIGSSEGTQSSDKETKDAAEDEDLLKDSDDEEDDEKEENEEEEDEKENEDEENEDEDEEDEDEEEENMSNSDEEEEEKDDDDDDVFDMSGDEDDEDEPMLEMDNKIQDKKESKKKNNKKNTSEYDVSRGIDFKNVSCVINYDFPLTKDSYIHRIGRTARAGNTGIALSVVHSDDKSANDLLQLLQSTLPLNNGVPQPSALPFNMKEIEAFRYRIEDVRRAVTRVAIKESRIKEIQQELYNNTLLQSHFEDNPQELNLLHHARALLPRRVKSYLRDIPEYLIPESLKTTHTSRALSVNGDRKNIYIKKRKNDPLQSFAMTMETLKSAPRNIVQSHNSEHIPLSGRNRWKLKHHKGVYKRGMPQGLTANQRIKRRAINKHGGKDKYGRQR